MNFLQMVNNVIDETGNRVDLLDELEFDNPKDPMHRRIKKWVSDAWKELQIDRGEWEFMAKDGIILVGPAIQFGQGTGTEPINGDVLTGNETGTTLEVISVSLSSGDFATNDAVGIMAVKDIKGQFKLNETFSNGTSTITLIGLARINIKGFLPDFDDFQDKTSIFIQETGGSTSQTNEGSAGLSPLSYATWSQWNDAFENNIAFGKPRVITTAPSGLFDLWPRPDHEYLLKFSYSVSPESIFTAQASPSSLEEKYHPAIVWKAVLDYADADGQRNLFFKAQRKVKWYEQKMNRTLLPSIAFSRSVFD